MDTKGRLIFSLNWYWYALLIKVLVEIINRKSIIKFNNFVFRLKYIPCKTKAVSLLKLGSYKKIYIIYFETVLPKLGLNNYFFKCTPRVFVQGIIFYRPSIYIFSHDNYINRQRLCKIQYFFNSGDPTHIFSLNSQIRLFTFPILCTHYCIVSVVKH